MTFGDSIKTCFAKYATFQGRASRSEFWYFALFGLGCYVIASIIDNSLNNRVTILFRHHCKKLNNIIEISNTLF